MEVTLSVRRREFDLPSCLATLHGPPEPLAAEGAALAAPAVSSQSASGFASQRRRRFGLNPTFASAARGRALASAGSEVATQFSSSVSSSHAQQQLPTDVSLAGEAPCVRSVKPFVPPFRRECVEATSVDSCQGGRWSDGAHRSSESRASESLPLWARREKPLGESGKSSLQSGEFRHAQVLLCGGGGGWCNCEEEVSPEDSAAVLAICREAFSPGAAGVRATPVGR